MRIIMVCGFTGSEKKNTLFAIGNELNSREKKVAVVITENEDSEDKSHVSADSGVGVREMISSCVPCSFLFDLMAELQKINELSAFDHVIIELPFNSMPAEVKEGLENLEFEDMSFAPIINVADAMNMESDVELIPKIIRNQIIDSEIIFITGDLAGSEKVAALSKTLGNINPNAEILENSTDSDDGIVGLADIITK
ncbi:GTP-binding protein [Methanolobus sp. ZRKC3]|uniref:GTP-binding protein n=1 Tax=Methanolobus sp. ZRKC3 TaxID=3125786 RepID=UPI003247DC9B